MNRRLHGCLSSWPPRSRRDTMFAPIRPSPTIPSFITSPLPRYVQQSSCRGTAFHIRDVGFHHPQVAVGDLGSRLLPRPGLRHVAFESLLPESPPDGEAGKAAHRRCDGEPPENPLEARSASEDDTDHLVAAGDASSLRNHSLAVRCAFEPFDLPDVGFYPPLLQLTQHLHHQIPSELAIKAFLL